MKKWLTLIAAMLLLAAAFLALMWKGSIQLNRPSQAEYPVRGVDVSYYQGEIDFSRLEQQGMRFAFIKATEGSSHVDSMLAQNMESVQKSSMRFGFYHFFSFDSSGKTQAENFIANVPVLEGMLPPVIDVEFYGDYSHWRAPESEAVEEQLRMLVDALEAAYGAKPIIYCTLSAYEHYIEDDFADCDLWIRSVYWQPELDWTFWQYTDKAKLDGYSGVEPCIDVNVFNGTSEDFLKYK